MEQAARRGSGMAALVRGDSRRASTQPDASTPVRIACALALLLLLASALCLIAAAVGANAADASPAFAIESFSGSFAQPPFSEPFLDEGGTPFTQAGGHPFALTATIDFEHKVKRQEVVDPGGDPEEEIPTEVLTYGDPRNVALRLAPGVIIDPRATPNPCTEVALETGSCPTSAAVGLLAAYVAGFPYRVFAPIYNMLPPQRIPAQLAANLGGLGIVIHLDGRLDPAHGYALTAELSSIPRAYPIYAVTVTLWGDPSDPAHDPQRGACAESPPSSKSEGVAASCPVGRSETPFMTMPTSCPGKLWTPASPSNRGSSPG